MRLTNYPLNHGIRWPYLNRPYPAPNYGGGLLTNQLTSFTSEASTVYVRSLYHREWSHYNHPRFILRPGISYSARSFSICLIFHLLEAHREFHSSSGLGDPQLIGLPPRTLLHVGICLRGCLYQQPSQTQARNRPAPLMPLTLVLLLTWRSHVVTWALSPEVVRGREGHPRW